MGDSEQEKVNKIKHIQTSEILDMILSERIRQLNNANSMGDFQKTKNDWVASAAFYLFEHSSKSDRKVSFDEFRGSLIKAASVIVAALEHSFNHDLIKEYNLDIESFLKDLNNGSL